MTQINLLLKQKLKEAREIALLGPPNMGLTGLNEKELEDKL